MNDYKSKYINIRTKLLEATDVAFRLGFEEGMKKAQVQQMQQQMQQAMAEQQAAMQAQAQAGGQPGSPEEQAMMEAMQQQAGGEGGGSPEEQAMMEAMQQQAGGEGGGSPEEQAMMEAVVQGQEPAANPEMASELDEKIQELESLVAKGEKPSVLSMRKAVENLATLRKSQKEKLSSKMAKQASSQKNFVDNLLKKWEQESQETQSDFEKIIKEHEINIEE